MYFIFKKQAGFTLIELIVSVFILSVAIVGVFSAFSVITILTSGAADRLTAIYLAQEGMEIARNIRDTNWDSGTDWLTGLTGCETGCQADYASAAMSPGNGDYLSTNQSGLYGYGASDNSSKTKFQRKIVITPITDINGLSDHIIKVAVQVSWDEKANILYPGRLANDCGASNCITADKVEGTLYDWYNYTSSSNK